MAEQHTKKTHRKNHENTSPSLGQLAGRSALWQIAGGGWQTLVRLGASVYLARALTPSDFGLFGMGLLYQELLVTALSFGFGTGLIVKKDLSEEDLSTAFWLSCTVRIIIFLVVFLSAPVAALFWKEPRVEPVIRVVSLTLLFQIIGMVPGTLATKHLQFKKINIIRAVAIMLESTTAIILVAFTGLTYWALVIGMILNALFYNAALWISSSCWLPKFNFCKGSFRYLFRFGFYTWLFGVANYLKQNVDYFLVGILLGSYQLGLYEFAYRLPHLVLDRVSRPVGDVLFPALSKIQDDNEKLFNNYVNAVKYVCLICYPILFILAATSDILVPFFWGDQWLPIVIPLQILCLCAALRLLFQPMGHIFYCKNRPDIPYKTSLIVLVFTIIIVGLLGHFYGLIGVASGMLLSVLPSFVILILSFFYLLKVNPFRFFLLLFPIFVSSISSYLVVLIVKKAFLVIEFKFFATLIFSSLLGLSVYLFFIFVLFPILRKEIVQKIKIVFDFSL